MCNKHDMDLQSQFCLKCGQAAEHIVDGKVSDSCHGGSNVIAVSHIIAKRRMAGLLPCLICHAE